MAWQQKDNHANDMAVRKAATLENNAGIAKTMPQQQKAMLHSKKSTANNAVVAKSNAATAKKLSQLPKHCNCT